MQKSVIIAHFPSRLNNFSPFPKWGGEIKRNMNKVCSHSQSGLYISFKREYLTPVSFMNVVINSKEIPKPKSHSCLPLGSEV